MTSVEIRDLFIRPPQTKAEFEQRLAVAGANAAELSAALVDQVENGEVAELHPDAFLRLFQFLGVSACATPLQRIVGRPDLPLERRRLAFLALTAEKEVGWKALAGIEVERLRELVHDEWLRTVSAVSTDALASRRIAAFLESTPKRDRESAFELWETLRKETPVSAARAYAHVLRSAELAALHKLIVALIVQEARADEIELMEQLAKEIERKPVKRELQRALLLARTSQLEPGAAAPRRRGLARVGACDGQGAFNMTLALELRAGRYDVAVVCIRAGADIRDGWVERDRSRSQYEKLNERMTEGPEALPAVDVPLEQAAMLIREAAARTTAMGRSIPKDICGSLEWIEPLEPVELPGDELLEGSQPEVATVERLRSILKAREHRWWFFDTGDLHGAGLDPPGLEVSARWLDEAARVIGRSSLRSKLLAMTRFMMRWHSWAGRLDVARVFAAAHRSLESLSSSVNPLIRVMLERAFAVGIAPEPRTSAARLGDPDLRFYIRTRSFGGIEHPTPWDLATFDATEVAYLALERAANRLAGSDRPRLEQLDAMALAIARGYVEVVQLFGAGGAAERRADRVMDEVRAKCSALAGLDASTVAPLVGEAGAAVAEFMDSVCTRCSIGCLERPDIARVGKAFFSSRHPAEELLRSGWGGS